MAGDDHPHKKMVAAGDIKGKEIAEQVENQSTSDDEPSDKIPVVAVAETSGSTATSTAEQPPAKKLKIDNAEQSTPPPLQVPCPLCERVFDSYPAMFGHQRVHKERTYRGAYPPPTFKREGSQRPRQLVNETEEAEQDVAEMLIELSKGKFEKSSANTSINQACGTSLDLNIPLEVEKSSEEEEAEEAEAAAEKGNVGLDLNKSPSGSE